MAALIGNGSHGRDIALVARRVHSVELERYDEDEQKAPAPLCGLPAFIGILDPVVRADVARRLAVRGPSAIVDPAAVCVALPFPFVGGVVMAGAVVMHSELGEHVHIGHNASVVRAKLGDFVTVCPGATICGDTEIGSLTLVGAGAVVADRVVIGSRCRIGAGAVVPPLSVVPDGTTVVGVWKPELAAHAEAGRHLAEVASGSVHVAVYVDDGDTLAGAVEDEHRVLAMSDRT